MRGRAPPLGRRAWIQHPEMLEPLHMGHVRVPVDDGLAVREPGGEPCLAASSRPGNVDHSDPHLPHLDDPFGRKRLAQRLLVHGPDHALHRWTELTQLLEDPGGDEVTSVQDQIRAAQEAQALVGKSAGAARQVRVGDDGDASQRR